MANESLNSASLVVECNIPQTLDEKFVKTSLVVECDIAQTLDEKLVKASIVVECNNANTLEERVINSSLVVAQVNENNTTVLVGSIACNDNEQQGDSSLFCFSGISGILIDDVTI